MGPDGDGYEYYGDCGAWEALEKGADLNNTTKPRATPADASDAVGHGPMQDLMDPNDPRWKEILGDQLTGQ